MVVALHWPSLGPYHFARLKAVQETAPNGTEVIAIGTAGTVEGRPWDHRATGIQTHTIFPDRIYHELRRHEVDQRVSRTLDELRPDAMAIAGYGMSDSRSALRWCTRNQTLRILMSETKRDDSARTWWRELVKRPYVARFDAAICGGTPHARYLEELGMERRRIFDKYDVVDNQFFADSVARLRGAAQTHLPGLESDQPFFLVVSRLIPRKNVDRLISAYATYRQRRATGWRLVVLGIGGELDRLVERVRSERIPDVTFAGFHQLNELVVYYSRAATFVHPALQEQWGLVVNEAMACSLPVLVSRTVGCAYDLVQDGRNGFLFDPNSVESIADVLHRMSSLPEPARKTMGDASGAIISDWTPRHFAENFWAAVQLGRRRGQQQRAVLPEVNAALARRAP